MTKKTSLSLVHNVARQVMAQGDKQAVGIDLGTTHSVIACLDTDGRPVTLRSAEGDLTTPEERLAMAEFQPFLENFLD